MYEEYYGFVQSPFTLAPDPRFLYLSESHHDAIRALLHSIRRREGFIVLTGDIGTGKTTLCRALLEQLDQTVFTSLVLNPFVSVDELLREVLLDYGIVSRDAVRSGRLASATRYELITTLHDFLLSLVPIGGSGVLIIDEAQHLSREVLEHIRVLSNLETNHSKLIQIVLVGQLNLLDILAGSDMRQLDQRVSLRATLKPLTRGEVESYVSHRLTVARGTRPVTFAPQALARIHALTGGIPRVVNLLCDKALAIGAERGATLITTEIVQAAAGPLGLQPPAKGSWLARWLTRGRVIAALVLLVGLLTAAPSLLWLLDTQMPDVPVRPPLQIRLPQPIEPLPIPADRPAVRLRRPPPTPVFGSSAF